MCPFKNTPDGGDGCCLEGHWNRMYFRGTARIGCILEGHRKSELSITDHWQRSPSIYPMIHITRRMSHPLFMFTVQDWRKNEFGCILEGHPVYYCGLFSSKKIVLYGNFRISVIFSTWLHISRCLYIFLYLNLYVSILSKLLPNFKKCFFFFETRFFFHFSSHALHWIKFPTNTHCIRSTTSAAFNRIGWVGVVCIICLHLELLDTKGGSMFAVQRS